MAGQNRAGAGERDTVLGFGDLYRACARDVYRFALYLSGDPALAEDMTSEAFMRAWNSDEPVRAETVKAYLFTIVRHLYLRERTKRARQLALTESIADPAPAIDESLDQKKRLGTVMAALQQLPETDRSALLMLAGKEMSYKQIADSLGLSLGALKVRIHRARLKLAELWRKG